MSRRSRIDIQFGRTLAIGQLVRHNDGGQDWRITQVHRADCTVEIKDDWNQRLVLKYADLRRDWSVYAPVTTRQEAALA